MRDKILIVGGPKDSGKTIGIQFLSSATEDLGYHVVNLNLKGVTDIKRAMNMFSKKLVSDVYNLKSISYIHDHLAPLSCHCKFMGDVL